MKQCAQRQRFESIVHARRAIEVLKSDIVTAAAQGGPNFGRPACGRSLGARPFPPRAALFKGEYGINDAVVGVPRKLDMGGILEISEIPLSSEEKERLIASAKN